MPPGCTDRQYGTVLYCMYMVLVAGTSSEEVEVGWLCLPSLSPKPLLWSLDRSGIPTYG